VFWPSNLRITSYLSSVFSAPGIFGTLGSLGTLKEFGPCGLGNPNADQNSLPTLLLKTI
jgi:hypothetical protein